MVDKGTAIDKEQIRQAVIVVIKDCYSSTHGFNKVFLRGGRIHVQEIKTFWRLLSEDCLCQEHGSNCSRDGGQEHKARDKHQSIVSGGVPREGLRAC
jgi:hypothetical protein